MSLGHEYSSTWKWNEQIVTGPDWTYRPSTTDVPDTSWTDITYRPVPSVPLHAITIGDISEELRRLQSSSPYTAPKRPELSDEVKAMTRLLGIPDEIRYFIYALACKPDDTDLMKVFADYLADQNRLKDEKTMRDLANKLEKK